VQIEGDIDTFIKVVANTNGTHVRWVPLDKGLAVFPGEMLRDSTTTVVMSGTPGQYRLLAYTALNDVPTDPVMTLVVIHGPQPPPIPVPIPVPVPQPQPVPVPPPQPVPVNQASKIWVVIVSNAAGVDPTTANVLGDMTLWNSVRAQGHEYRNYNPTQPEYQKYKSLVTKNGGVPCIIILDANRTDHNWLNQGTGELGIPLSGSAGVKALINKYTSRPVP
jgi:hypothetical protein